MNRNTMLLLLAATQIGAGVVTAYLMIRDLAAGKLFSAAMSAGVMLLVARYDVPPPSAGQRK